jgi:hypothetical protein
MFAKATSYLHEKCTPLSGKGYPVNAVIEIRF